MTQGNVALFLHYEGFYYNANLSNENDADWLVISGKNEETGLV